ncbi:MAG: hypothetical protein ACYSTS_06130 [Planctomycetota bacterium]|jgi:hypothetical protein
MKIIFLSCLLLVFTLSPVYGENYVPANDEKNKHNEATFQSKLKKWFEKVTTPEDNVITLEDKKIIMKYLKGVSAKKKHKVKKKSLPPGLAKKLARGGTLPPGWQMKVARGEVMDYEVYNNAISLPEELLRKISAIPEGTVLLHVGNKIVKVIEASRKIVDLFEI